MISRALICSFDRPWKRRSLKADKLLGLATGLLQPGRIGPHLQIQPEPFQRRVQNRRRRCVHRPLDSVVHPLPLAPRPHNPGIPQIRQMPRDLRLALPQDLHKIADADLCSIHQMQQAQTSRVGQCRKQPGEVHRLIQGISIHPFKYTP